MLSTSNLLPHGYCINWSPSLLWIYVLSDAMTFLAYYTIPFSLIYIVHRRKDLNFGWIFMLFSLFILACGTTHLLGIVILWKPIYWIDAVVKAFTAITSVITAIALVRLIPEVLKIPSAEQLAKEVQAKVKAYEELKTSQKSLLDANNLLEQRVQKRTEELHFQNGEKEKRSAELVLANKELHFQNGEKEKRSAELVMANKELNAIEKSLLLAKSEAEKANLSKSKFLAAASHDLRQPLTALSLYVDVLTKQNNSDDSVLGNKIQGCVSSLSELLDNLLNVSKLDAGVVLATKTTFRLSDVLGSLVNIHAAEAAQKGISLHVRCSNLITHTDPTILQRILGNLIANAIRYTDKGGVLIGCRRHNGKQWIEVWDTGVGFPSNMAEHIFEEFTQLGDNSRRIGSGLGLAIVSKSAKLLGLELRVHSRLGRGSMFAIEIPQGDATLIETSAESKAVVDKYLIALIDDNPMVLEATSFALTAMGHQVIAAESELDLLKNIGYHEPDILISDYRLADNKTGLDLILKTRKMFGENLPAILITGDTDPKLIKLFTKHEIKVCYKPLKIDVLNNLISEVMFKA